MEQALNFGIQCLMSTKPTENDAVMFDVDDTLLRTDGIPIVEMISLFHTCSTYGFKTVIITARPHYHENVEFTKQQLVSFGIVPDKLFFTPPENKTVVKKISDLNYILSVGDQYTDLDGSKHYIKLPDKVDKNIYTK